MHQSNQYRWAMDASEIASQIRQAAKDFYCYVNTVGLMGLWRKSERLAYGLDASGRLSNSMSITTGGEEGELLQLRANHYASLGQSITAMCTGTRLAISCHAVNSDYESEIAADLAAGLLEYYYRERNLEDVAIECLEMSLFAAEGWLDVTWDRQKGEIYQYEQVVDDRGEVQARPIYDGDINAIVRHPIDVIRDYQREDMNFEWLVVRKLVNRWDLAAAHPEQRQEILSVPLFDGVTQEQWLWSWQPEKIGTQDMVPVYCLYHKATPAMPVGRQTMICGTAVLSDDVLQYNDLPLTCMSAWRKRKTAFGWTRMWDLMALQEAYDSIISTMVTNHDIAGVVNLWTPTNDDIVTEDLSGGARHITSANMPQVIKSDPISNSSKMLSEIVNKLLETLSGVNAVARGNVEGTPSGASLALIHSMALEFSSPYQRSYGRATEVTLTKMIDIFQRYATTPRFAAIVGKGEKADLQAWKAEDIKPVRRAVVDLGSPVTRTLAGRMEMGFNLIQQQQVNAQQYIELVQTGRIEDIWDPVKSERRLIKAENEMMLKGQAPKLSPTDHHKLHVQEHKALLDNPKYRYNEALMGIAVAHIQEHMDAWLGSPPALLVLSGQEPPDPSLLPANMMASVPGAPQPGGPPPEQGKGPPPKGEPKPESNKAQVPGTQDGPPSVVANLPNMPKNPLQTGSTQPAKKR